MSLTKKCFLALAFTLLCEVMFAVSLVQMQQGATESINSGAAIQSLISRMNTVSNLWSNLAADSCRILMNMTEQQQMTLSQYRTQFQAHFNELLKLATDARSRDEIAKLKEDTMAVIDFLGQVQLSLQWHNKKAFSKNLTAVRVLVDQATDESSALVDRLLAEQQANYKEQVSRQSALKVLLGSVVGMNLMMIFAMGIWFTRDIGHKYSIITDNCERMASGMPLNPVLSGSDEISMLDQKFHEMSNELLAANMRERAAVDNAIDLICSLDANGRFLSLNPAAESILGYRADQ
ncbi:MAG TPA: PAS domain-containing protein, partial [Chroococcales cyanobacterium]